MKPQRPVTSANSRVVMKDDNDFDTAIDREKADNSMSSEFSDKDKNFYKAAVLHQDNPESDFDSSSSSTDESDDSVGTPSFKNASSINSSTDSSVCAACGRGPFKSMKLHLLHCRGVKIHEKMNMYSCFLCKEIFKSENSLRQHLMTVYSCHICGQVFSYQDSYNQHQCPKGSKLPLVLFCPDSLLPLCKICKTFFSSEKTLLEHFNNVHTSVVSNKVRIINPSATQTGKKLLRVSGTASNVSKSNVVNQVVNGSPLLHLTPPSRPGRPPSSTRMMTSSSEPFTNGNDSARAQSTSQYLNSLPALSVVPYGTTNTSPATVASVPVSGQTLTIIAMFRNNSIGAALMKRKETGWRSKAPHPCRQCGAILRQLSLIIRHRYLHRGQRSQLCECGRAFKHRLHLLRHCIQHAETSSYICVSCGKTFTGANLLAKHMKGKPRTESCGERTWRRKIMGKCRTPFTCDCGQNFYRPSAYIWHQLKNRTKTKRLKKPL